MVTLDGSLGDGGGQVLRAALGLSLATGEAFRITNLRAGRDKTGLLRQHLAAVRAATAVCGAATEGAAVGSKSLTFTPGVVRAGEHAFVLGSAVSAPMVLQALLPALTAADGPSSLSLEGGTHIPASPPFEFVQKSLLPLVNRTGPEVSATLHRAGFYPAGGGRITAEVRPVRSFVPLHLGQRGEIRHRRCTAIVAALPGEIALRELELVKRTMDWPDECFTIRQLPDDEGPGNVLMIEIGSESVTEVFAAFGQRGVRAEAVAESVIQQVKAHLGSGIAVGPQLAEHLLVPLAVGGGGSMLTAPLTRRAAATIEVIRAFLDIEVTAEERATKRWLVTVPAGSPTT